ncbi:MAG: PD-(D/E)XK nuclease-like domain-containing protein [Arsenophonus endosymbiont of Dermacentor nuttalli]
MFVYPLDVKSCCDTTEHQFSQAFGKYYYHIQAAFYLYVFYLYVLKLVTRRELNQFCFFALENTPPYKNCMYYIGKDSLKLGYKTLFKSLHKLKKCIENESLRTEEIVLPPMKLTCPIIFSMMNMLMRYISNGFIKNYYSKV